MSLSILNSISSLTAETQLSSTQANLQKTLTQLSTGLRINSGADDAAGLSISAGMTANIAALTQSSQNASNAIGFLQTADGALSQVTSMLNRAVTLATEASSSGLTANQSGALNTEYQSLMNEIGQIGSSTQFNGAQVFTDGASSPVDLAGNGSALSGTINPADTVSGAVTVTSTVPGVAGTTTAIDLVNEDATVTPGAALSGSITITSTIPASSSTQTPVTLSSSSTAITGTVDPAQTLSGNISVTSTIPAHGGTPQNVTFTASGTGATEAISSSVITTGATLSGSLVVDSSIGSNTSDAINLANYQNLSSSDSALATDAANQLATDLTSAIGGATGSVYSASISGGVLKITTSNPQTATSLNLTASGNTMTSAPLVTGDTLSGDFFITSTGGAEDGVMSNWSASSEQGLTSSNPGTVSATLASFENKMNTSSWMGGSTHSTYTATINGSNELVITSSNANERFAVYDSPTETNAGEALSVGGGSNAKQAVPVAEVDTPDSFSLTGVTAANLQTTLQGDLGSNYAVTYDTNSGALAIGISAQGTSAGVSSIALNSYSLQEATAGSSAQNIPTTINLTGVATTNLQQTISQALGSAYTVNYDQDSGALSIGLNSGNAEGYTASSGTSAGFQTVGGSAAVNTPTVISLDGATKANLAATLLSQLGGAGGNYTVSYDQTSGALSIGISAAGTSAGITSISFGGNSLQQTAPAGTPGLGAMNVFASDGTTGGSTSLNIAVGTLSTAKLGTSNEGAGVDLSGTDLLSATNAASTLTQVTSALSSISAQRGTIGANVNQLTAASNVMTGETQNLQSAENSIQNADIGKTVASMTQYNILQSTGMAALQQSNQAQQAVLKLIQ